jgi:hypothetical protein
MIFRKLEVGDSLFSCHGGKPLKKLVQSRIIFQMIEEGLDGDTGASKAWGASKDFWIYDDGSGQSDRIHKVNLRSMVRRSSGVRWLRD